jgi:phytanoyl-CoA hydroxylase
MPADLLHADAAAVDVVAALAHYREHGWARLGRLASDDTLAGLRERTEQIMRGEVVIDGLFFQHDSGTGRYQDLEYGRGWVGPSLAYRKLEKLERDERFAAWIGNPVYAAIARAWIGPQVSLYRSVIFNKAAHGGMPLPWHQDGGLFWGIDRDPTLQIWLALDDVPVVAGCVEVVPGSHARGLTTRQGGVIPDDVLSRAGEVPILALPARAGEALLIHNHVWHRSAANDTAHPRRALTVCLMDAATRCLRKKHAPREFYRVL